MQIFKLFKMFLFGIKKCLFIAKRLIVLIEL